MVYIQIITGPPNTPELFCWLAYVVVCRRRLSLSVRLPACGPAGRPGAWAVGRPTLHGGPVQFRPARTTPCLRYAAQVSGLLFSASGSLTHGTTCRVIRNFSPSLLSSVPLLNRRNFALPTWPKINKIWPGSVAVTIARIAPKICEGQPPKMYLQSAPDFIQIGSRAAEL